MATVVDRPSASASDFESSDKKLRHVLSRTQLLMLSLGAIIGSGWLFSAIAADELAGPASYISWIVGGVLVLLIALAYAEVATMLPRSGAIARYPHLTHGGFTGFLLGWAYLLASASVPAIEAIAVVQYLGPHAPASWKLLDSPVTTTSIIHFPEGWLFTAVLLLFFFFINLYGARFLGRFNNAVMVWKIAIPVLTFILIFALTFHSKNFAPPGGMATFGWSKVFYIIPTAGIIFSYLGFRQALDFGGEAKNPQRDIPFATIVSVIVGIVIYTLLQVAFTGGIVWKYFGVKYLSYPGLSAPTTSAAHILAVSSPFFAIMRASGVAFLVSFFAYILIADAAISPGGTGYIYLGTGGRTIYGMGVSGYFPKQSTAMSRRTRIPWVALIASFIVALAFSAPSSSWFSLVGIITSMTVFTYIMGGISLQIFRRTAPDLARPYRLGAAGFWAPVAFLAAAVIVFWSGYTTLAELVAMLFIGLPLYAWFFAANRGYMNKIAAYVTGVVFLVAWILLQHWGHWILSPANAAPYATNVKYHAPFILWFILSAVCVYAFVGLCWLFGSKEGRRLIERSIWLVTFILAEFLLSYYSSFGVTLHQPKLLTFPFDTIWALLIGLVCYYWAVASGYETDEIREIVDSGSGLIAEEVGATS
jgi:amino acid transporter